MRPPSTNRPISAVEAQRLIRGLASWARKVGPVSAHTIHLAIEWIEEAQNETASEECWNSPEVPK